MPGTLFVIAENFGFLVVGPLSRCGSWVPRGEGPWVPCYGARMEKKLSAFVCHFIAHLPMCHFMAHLKPPQLPRAKHHFGILKKSPKVVPKNFTYRPPNFFTFIVVFNKKDLYL